MAEGEWDVVAEAAAACLADLDKVLVDVASTIRESIPEYAYVTDEQLRYATHRNITSLLVALMERRTLLPEELTTFEETVEARARSGVPLDEYLSAVTVAEASVWDAMWQRATRKVSPEQMLEAFALRFATIKTVTRVTATAHRRIDLLTAREDYERRALALRSLLRGNLSADEVREHGGRLGLDLSRPYLVIRARATGAFDSDQVQRLLAGRRNHPPHAAFALWGEDVVGLLADSPQGSDSVTVGMAGPMPLEQLSRAHEEAQVAFSTAWSLDLRGVFSLADLGLRPAVQQLPEMGQGLRQKYVAPLHGSGSLGSELLATVRAYLEAGSRREGAASQLHVHINTVGYRIGRFTELTGADLTDFTTLAELWWLFTDLDLRPA